VVRLAKLRPDIEVSAVPRPRTSWRWGSVVVGTAFLVVGILIGHGAGIVWSEAHEPEALAVVDSRSCYDSQSDTGDQELCNVAVHFDADGHRVRSTMGAIDAGDIRSGTITVLYPPRSPALIVPARENGDGSVLVFVAIAAGMFAASFVSVRPLWRARLAR
jgi:hypothetical protein